MIMKMLPITEGEIYVDGVEIQHMNSEQTKEYRKKIQMVFQMPTESFNPRIKLGKSIKEAMSKTLTSVEKEEKLKNLFDECLLEYELADRYPK